MLAEDAEGRLEFSGFVVVVGVEHAADDGFTDTEPAGEFGPGDAGVGNGPVECEFGAIQKGMGTGFWCGMWGSRGTTRGYGRRCRGGRWRGR